LRNWKFLKKYSRINARAIILLKTVLYLVQVIQLSFIHKNYSTVRWQISRICETPYFSSGHQSSSCNGACTDVI